MARSKAIRVTAGRRSFLLGSAAMLAGLGAGRGARAANDEGMPFDFEILTRKAERLSAAPYKAPAPTEGLPEGLTYDLYRQIAFDPDHARWQDSGAKFRLHAFHMGWLFPIPVLLHEVAEGMARPMTFSTDDFQYRHEAAGILPPHAELPGVAGFRLHWPLNRADVIDELIAFQGASYFRALGRGSAYGLSARGLALSTASDRPEEFPTFQEFYLERPGPGDRHLTLYALLDSPSVAGAYRFDILPGEETVTEVTARLFFRSDTPEVGVAPLTSMYLYSASNRSDFDDYRPQVHDSDGLFVARGNGETLWRALQNPANLATSYFAEPDLKGFGLFQRDREYAHYEDPGARYQDRPSVLVEPIGDWGDGDVRLVEIPSDLEANDNIVAYWRPRHGAAAGEAQEYRYRLHWGMLPPDPKASLAYVLDTRSGKGGVSGVKTETKARKFIVDFAGGLLSGMDGTADVSPVVVAEGGAIVDQALFRVPEMNAWRLSFDVAPEGAGPVELMAHVEGYDQRLSETWLFQWNPRG